MSTEIQTVRKDKLVELAPFIINYSTAKLVQKVSKEGKRYSTIDVEISPYEIPDQRYSVSFWQTEYKNICALGLDNEALSVVETLNQKTGAVQLTFVKWSKK